MGVYLPYTSKKTQFDEVLPHRYPTAQKKPRLDRCEQDKENEAFRRECTCRTRAKKHSLTKYCPTDIRPLKKTKVG